MTARKEGRLPTGRPTGESARCWQQRVTALAMRDGGCSIAEIADHLQISRSRVYQHLSPRREPIIDPVVVSTPTAERPFGIRPRLRKAESGLWECSDGIVERAARTFEGAYQKWLTAAIREAQEAAMARQPVALA